MLNKNFCNVKENITDIEIQNLLAPVYIGRHRNVSQSGPGHIRPIQKQRFMPTGRRGNILGFSYLKWRHGEKGGLYPFSTLQLSRLSRAEGSAAG